MRALDVVGERWALPVVRELIFGPRRYSDLATALPGVSTNILGTRLKELTQAGVLDKRRLPPPAPATVYELTTWGAALEPALIALGRWGAHIPVDMEQQFLSAASFALSLKATFDPEAAVGVNLVVQLVMGEDVFDARIEDGNFLIRRAANPTSVHAPSTDRAAPPAIHLHADPKSLAALVHMGLDLSEASRNGVVRIDGPPSSVEMFVRCFTLPEPPAGAAS